MPATRFSADVNRLRAALRGCHGEALIRTLAEQIERIPAAALAADNAQRYVAANAAALALTGYDGDELRRLTVMDLTPPPETADGGTLWQEFISRGGQRGRYDLLTRSGLVRPVRYWAFASVAPGVHLSLLVPTEPRAGDG